MGRCADFADNTEELVLNGSDGAGDIPYHPMGDPRMSDHLA
jgi:hypothetical protein